MVVVMDAVAEAAEEATAATAVVVASTKVAVATLDSVGCVEDLMGAQTGVPVAASVAVPSVAVPLAQVVGTLVEEQMAFVVANPLRREW